MEAKKEEFIVTAKWLEKNGAYEDDIQDFEQHFPNGGEALEVLKRCEELGYRDFGEWLVDHLPPIYTPLVLNTFVGNLFYPNDVHIKGDVFTQEVIRIKGSLKVDGKLTINKLQRVFATFVNADEIDIGGYAWIRGTVIAKVINFKGGSITGDVDADEIINDGGAIWGNVNTIKIKNINGGEVAGKITYKRSDEHK
ncbi:polymer-forming cytoskeletal protein [Snodgrassella alvi]|uniref:polymer-forming cytoskeletal protein n=1 Tax=Snodgrassella alvi TaxID=1196083 RepID=UPI00351C26E0